jgi:translocation and assembly module TamB
MKFVFKIGLAVVLLPVVLMALVLVVLNTGPGQRFAAREIGAFTGGQVVLRGLSGRFPDALRLAHAEIRDTKGVWLTLDGLVLDWSPLALFGRTASVSLLSADRIGVARLPVASAQAAPSQGGGGFSLPVHVDVGTLRVTRLDLGAPVAGTAASVNISGEAHVASLEAARAKISIDRLDGAGSYRLDATLTPANISALLTAQEPQGGLVSGLAKLPALGALDVTASVEGPRTAERTNVKIAAGHLGATASGTVDLIGQSVALDVSASAPAMAPRPDISWGSIEVASHVHGKFRTPDVSAHVLMQDVRGGGAVLKTLTADASGNRGTVDVHTVLTGLVIPGAKPDLFANAPLDFSAHADLDKPDIPVRFALTHTLLTADGTANVGVDISARVHTVVPDLAPLAALGNVDLQGKTEAVASMATHGADTDVKLDGTAEFTGGQSPVPALLAKTTYGATARLAGQDIFVSRAVVDSGKLHASVTGSDTLHGLSLAWTLLLNDLAAASPQLKGALTATGRVDGPQTGLAVQADITGKIGTASVPEGPLAIKLHAENLPAKPSGTVEAEGRFAGSPLSLSADLARQDDGGFHAVIKRAAWRSFAADADMVLPKGANFPLGTFSARMARLADLAPVIGQQIAGAFHAKFATAAPGGRPDAKIDFSGSSISVGANQVQRVSLAGTVRDPASKTPKFSLVLAADGIAASKATGSARVIADGALDALSLRATSDLDISGAPATLLAQALLDLPAKRVTLQNFLANSKNEALRLASPARVDFGGAVGVDRLRLALGAATLDVAGTILPRLDLTASLRNVTPDLAKPFDPSLNAAGVLTANARLTGTAANPAGTVRVQATGVRMRGGPAASLPAGSLQASIGLQGGTASIDAHVSAGPKLHFAATGTAPLQAGAPLRLHATGGFDLTLLDPVLNAGGRRAAGRVALNADASGTAAAPRIDGEITLTGGEVQDFVQGVRLSDITARLTEAGDTLQVQNFSAKAGPGTMSLTGTIGVLAPGLPVNVHFAAKNARPLSSDLLTANLDADVSVRGDAASVMDASGKIFVRRTDINIPDALPPSVAVLNVRRPGYKPPPPAPPTPQADINLAIEVDAPNSIFVRGHGLDSELGGKLTVGGTASGPQIAGGFQMRRGDISVAGTTLTFSKGEVGFDGTSVTGKIDPTLDFVADSISGGVTATLTVGGYADAPKITLSSVPDLPQDEVLSHLLFGTSVKNLSAIQIAEIASALAELSGVTGGGGDPLAAVRKGLGLDRLSVGSGSGSGTGATVEAGRYVARGVYVGAKQATSGSGTAAVVQVDITKRLKATAQLATGGGSVQGATPDNDPGSTIGLSYGFDY